MIIAIDIGNTNISFGVFEKTSDQPVYNANIQTDKNMTTDELAIKYMNLRNLWTTGKNSPFNNREIDEEVIISSVVPRLDYEFRHMFEKYYNKTPHFVTISDASLKINYNNPSEVGADRIVNALGGVMLYQGFNLIIIDFGTATTFDIVEKSGIYEGGLIIPGVMTSLSAMEEKASKLPHIDLSIPSRLIGKYTVESIRSGLINGNGAMVDNLVERVINDMNWTNADTKVIATGGLSKIIKPASLRIDVLELNLTLRGLYYVWKSQK